MSNRNMMIVGDCTRNMQCTSVKCHFKQGFHQITFSFCTYPMHVRVLSVTNDNVTLLNVTLTKDNSLILKPPLSNIEVGVVYRIHEEVGFVIFGVRYAFSNIVNFMDKLIWFSPLTLW